MSKRTDNQEEEKCDVLVVGAGVSGLYFTYSLLTRKSSAPKTILFEGSSRVGGRLATSFTSYDDIEIKVEEGGMRFLPHHRYLHTLIEDLDLKNDVRNFKMGDPKNIYYLRGHRFTRAEVRKSKNKKWSTIYALRSNEVGYSIPEILTKVRDEILRINNSDPKEWRFDTPSEWERFRIEMMVDGHPLYKWGFAPLLTRLGLSGECLQLLWQSGGFSCPFDTPVNAGAAFQLFGNFGEKPRFKTLLNGYESLPDRLQKRILDSGGSIRLSHTVTDISSSPSGYTVTYRTGGAYKKRIDAKAVVLALPTQALDVLLAGSKFLTQLGQLREDVRSVVSMPLTKINLYYSKHWWRDRFSINTGGNFTDLPIAQVYVFDPYNRTATRGPGALTIYCDSTRATFWLQLQQLKPEFASATETVPHVVKCSKAVVQEATKQLSEMFGAADIDMPFMATYRSWGIPGIGDGDHLWKIDVNDEDVRRRLSKPRADHAVHVCGESYSDDQCWVEGALRSAEMVLQRHFLK
jgi:monoamine oxidase